MKYLIGAAGLGLIFGVLVDSFETIILPRRVTHRLRLTSLFHRITWHAWCTRGRRMPPGGQREDYLGIYGPLSLLMLLAVWIVGLLVGFAALTWALGSALNTSLGRAGFGTDLYMSGTTFFTLGLGDVVPRSAGARLVTVLEVGTGFAFLALVIGYVPVLYQAFARREVDISLLDARAGSPPTAVELLRRCGESPSCTGDDDFLRPWERWCAELMETHLSYPNLGYFRSQHENQSWIAALTVILDAAALICAAGDGPSFRQARLTFAMARHAAVDLAHAFDTPPFPPDPDRLPAAEFTRLRSALARTSVLLSDDGQAHLRLAELRQMYEPYVNALSSYLLMPLPNWLPEPDATDNWESTAWGSAQVSQLI